MTESTHDPYAPPTAPVEPPPLISSSATKADRSTRLLAAIIDGLIAIPAWLPIFSGAYMAQDPGGRVSGLVLMLVGLIVTIALATYQLKLMARAGQTIGKRSQGIRVVRLNGERISLGRWVGLRAVVPGLIGAIPYLGGLFSLADVLWIFGEERRCLHDLIADTIVVNV